MDRRMDVMFKWPGMKRKGEIIFVHRAMSGYIVCKICTYKAQKNSQSRVFTFNEYDVLIELALNFFSACD